MFKLKYYAIIMTVLFLVAAYDSYHSTETTKNVFKTATLMHETYKESITQCILEINELERNHKREVESILQNFHYVDYVDVTMYNAVPEQTNAQPLITASGATITFDKATEHRWLAVSRDLHARWGGPLSFGDVVYLKGTGQYDGIYVIEDLMNKRWTKRVDILKTVGSPKFMYEEIEMYKLDGNLSNFFLTSNPY